MNPEVPQNNVPPTVTPEQQYTAPQPQTQLQPEPVTQNTSGSKGMAITALVLSILGFLTGFILIGFALALVGLILSILGLVKRKPGKGLNIASLIISGLCLLSSPFVILYTLVAYQGITERADQGVYKSQLRNDEY